MHLHARQLVLPRLLRRAVEPAVGVLYSGGGSRGGSGGSSRRGRLPRGVGGATDLGEGGTAVEERPRRSRHPVLALYVL